MPRISKEHKQLYKSKIRSLLAQNPQISQRELQLRLDQDGTKLDRKYLGSLLKAIYRERIKRAAPMPDLDPSDSTSVPLFSSPKLLPLPPDLSTLLIQELLTLLRHTADFA